MTRSGDADSRQRLESNLFARNCTSSLGTSQAVFRHSLGRSVLRWTDATPPTRHLISVRSRVQSAAALRYGADTGARCTLGSQCDRTAGRASGAGPAEESGPIQLRGLHLAE